MKKLIILVCIAVSAAMSIPSAQADDAAAKRQTCVDAMNADPEFARSIVVTVDKQIDAKTIKAHEDAAQHIAENETHVLLAYAAMWICAALFVVFLWRRQQALKAEIAQLRRDLDAAGKS